MKQFLSVLKRVGGALKNFGGAVKRFFAPPPNSTALVRIAPYLVVAFLVSVLFLFSAAVWEYTNQTDFCGLTCHTMPPNYQIHQRSAHANVNCEDCHLGRDSLSVMVPRKIQYSLQTGTSMILGTYHYPISAMNMRPARDVCENCHNPQKFSSDKMSEIKRFANDKANTMNSIYMLIKTGGGSTREGLGQGIHWHVENPVYFYAEDVERQIIPYVKVTRADGTVSEYVDVEANIDPEAITEDQLQVMDCITCHNRIAHTIRDQTQTMDDLMGRKLVSPTIPEIHKKGVEILNIRYNSQEMGFAAIDGLENYYKQYYAEYYQANVGLIKSALSAIKDAYSLSFFADQKLDFSTHPDNIQHWDSPGCFRCHDGKHVSFDGKDTVRLECNLCHSIPTISTPFELTSSILVSKGVEPEMHKNPNWINMHRTGFDITCQSCHTVEDPGGISNTSFCSNSICHGSNFKFLGLDAPKVREIIQSQMPTLVPSPTPAPTATAAPTIQGGQPTKQPTPAVPAGPVTYEKIGPILEAKCKACHGESGIKGLSLISYARVMAGAAGGPVVSAGNPDDSSLVKVQLAGKHPGQFSPEELDLVKQWISGGALEK